MLNRFQLNEEWASQLLKQLQWTSGQDMSEFANHVKDLVRTAYPEFSPGQQGRQSIKELLRALPASNQTVGWELTNRPRDTVRDVVGVIQQFITLRAPTTVNAVATPEVEDLKQQIADQAQLLQQLLESQQLLQQRIQDRAT